MGMPSQPVRLYQGDKVKADQLISADGEIGEKDDGGQDKMLQVIRVQRCRKGYLKHSAISFLDRDR